MDSDIPSAEFEGRGDDHDGAMLGMVCDEDRVGLMDDFDRQTSAVMRLWWQERARIYTLIRVGAGLTSTTAGGHPDHSPLTWQCQERSRVQMLRTRRLLIPSAVEHAEGTRPVGLRGKYP